MNGRQLHVPNLTFINKIIIAISVGLFLINSVIGMSAGSSLVQLLGLSASGMTTGHLYQLFTYPLVSSGLFDVLINCLLLWFIGSELEQIWGRKRYSWFLGTAAVGGGIIYLIVVLIFFNQSPIFAFPLSGLAGIVSALCVAYAILFPDRLFTFMLLFPMKAKYFCMLMIGLTLYSGIFNSAGGAQAWGHLGTIAAGVMYMWIVSKPKMKDLFSNSLFSKGIKKPRKNSHLTIVKDDDDKDKPPKYWQ
jgi:membrane associated rhomboid family serine protease